MFESAPYFCKTVLNKNLIPVDNLNREAFQLPSVEQILERIQPLKDEIYNFGIKFLFENDTGHILLSKSKIDARAQEMAAKIALATTCYNQVYPLSRFEALQIQKWVSQNCDEAAVEEINTIASQLQKDNLTIAALNYAFYSLVNEKITDGPDWIVEDRERFVPRQGFGVIGPQHIYCNADDYHSAPPTDIYVACFDLHDLIHYALGSVDVCFASKYFSIYNAEGEIEISGLESLPDRFKILIISSPKNKHPKSDGHILSNLIYTWFYEKFDQMKKPWEFSFNNQSRIEMVDCISKQLKNYLLDSKIHPLELAVLMQNKLYEATASECETLAFVRGGAGNPLDSNHRGRADLDMLSAKSPLEKVKAIAAAAQTTDFRFHHEDRNTLRNKAQVAGYREVSLELEKQLGRKPDMNGNSYLTGLIELCKKIQQAGTNSNNINLFDEVYKIIKQHPDVADF